MWQNTSKIFSLASIWQSQRSSHQFNSVLRTLLHHIPSHILIQFTFDSKLIQYFNYLTSIFRYLFERVQYYATRQFSSEVNTKYTAVGSFLFLRFLIPALLVSFSSVNTFQQFQCIFSKLLMLIWTDENVWTFSLQKITIWLTSTQIWNQIKCGVWNWLEQFYKNWPIYNFSLRKKHTGTNWILS